MAPGEVKHNIPYTALGAETPWLEPSQQAAHRAALRFGAARAFAHVTAFSPENLMAPDSQPSGLVRWKFSQVSGLIWVRISAQRGETHTGARNGRNRPHAALRVGEMRGRP